MTHDPTLEQPARAGWRDQLRPARKGLTPSSLNIAGCARRYLQPGDHLVEIGTGWGGMAIHAASTRGCRVTTTTISREQHDVARQRIGAAGVR